MRQAGERTKRNTRTRCALAFLATLACAGLAALPAQAGNDFRDGFEDQLGRLVAVEAFHVGRWILSGGHPAHYRFSNHARPSYYERHRHHAHRRPHHDSPHRHRVDEPCNVETHERITRNRHGRVIEYERHEVRRPDHDHRDSRYARW